MHKKGEKFVIEIDDIMTGDNGEILYKIKGFNSLVFDDYGLDQIGKLVNGVDSFSKSLGYGEGYREGFQDGVEKERRRVNGLIESITNPEKNAVRTQPFNKSFWGEEALRELKRNAR